MVFLLAIHSLIFAVIWDVKSQQMLGPMHESVQTLIRLCNQKITSIPCQ